LAKEALGFTMFDWRCRVRIWMTIIDTLLPAILHEIRQSVNK
jgi:hypothetical protein